MTKNNPTVAVVGLGSFGLVTMKNLMEEGFDVTGFERSSRVGGLWQYEDGSKTTVLESTVANVSKQRFCYTDFPFDEDANTYATAGQMARYLERYAEHFGLYPHIRTDCHVRKVSRIKEQNAWEVSTLFPKRGEEVVVQRFDKVVMATGINDVPFVPTIKGIEKFGGTVLHSGSYKRPAVLAKKRVIVIGMNNSAGDTATSLLEHAGKIYLCHRGGSIVALTTGRRDNQVSRIVDGKPIDHGLSYGLGLISHAMTYYAPSLSETITKSFIVSIQRKCFKIPPEWNFELTTPVLQSLPIANEDLVPALHDGKILPVPAIREVLDADTLELDDGTTIQADAIIFCTGYKAHFSTLGPHDPCLHTTPEWAASKGSNGRPLPRLYQNIFSLDFPDSLAFMKGVGFQMPVFQVYDLASMALAQVWKGTSTLPSREEMSRHTDAHHKWMCELAKKGTVPPDLVQVPEWYRWVNDAAGTGVNENLGYGAAGWKFWRRERQFCNMLMWGLFSPHIYRLFEGKRKAWSGARAAIEKVNRECREKKEWSVTS